jgi:hypothetical protein
VTRYFLLSPLVASTAFFLFLAPRPLPEFTSDISNCEPRAFLKLYNIAHSESAVHKWAISTGQLAPVAWRCF